MIKAIIFDIGGVLAYNVWEHLLLDKNEGIAAIFNLDEERVYKAGKNLWDKFAFITANKENDSRKLEKKYWDFFIKEIGLHLSTDYFIQLTDKFVRPVEGMYRLLECLQAEGIDLAICSNNTEFWFEHIMSKLGLYRFFDPNKIILSSRIGVSKSSPNFEMFQMVIDALDVDKDNCIFIDNSKKNIGYALKFGITGILFPTCSEYGAKYLMSLLKKMNVFKKDIE